MSLKIIGTIMLIIDVCTVAMNKSTHSLSMALDMKIITEFVIYVMPVIIICWDPMSRIMEE